MKVLKHWVIIGLFLTAGFHPAKARTIRLHFHDLSLFSGLRWQPGFSPSHALEFSLDAFKPSCTHRFLYFGASTTIFVGSRKSGLGWQAWANAPGFYFPVTRRLLIIPYMLVGNDYHNPLRLQPENKVDRHFLSQKIGAGALLRYVAFRRLYFKAHLTGAYQWRWAYRWDYQESLISKMGWLPEAKIGIGLYWSRRRKR